MQIENPSLLSSTLSTYIQKPSNKKLKLKYLHWRNCVKPDAEAIKASNKKLKLSTFIDFAEETFQKMSERKGTKALELWCKRLIRDCPDIRIENMSTSWRDGMAFCALVHHFRPDLIDMSKLKHENIYENNQLAFSVAEKHLGIPALLDPEDMVENDVPDRLSILTYLSQFYQRLGHTVNTKVSESEAKSTESASEASGLSAPIKFGKTGLDKCTACGLPVYLAQRLMVSHKLYHRRCFRCSKCSGHLNPKNFHVVEGSEFLCDSCKNDKNLMKYLNNNDHNQMGMLAFSDNLPDAKVNISTEEIVISKTTPRPTSILDKISMFEKKSDKDFSSKIDNIPVKDSISTRFKDITSTSGTQSETDSKLMPENIHDNVNNESVLNKDTESNVVSEKNSALHESSLDKDINSLKIQNNKDENNEGSQNKNVTENLYKSNLEKYNFLQTQLASDTIEINKTESMEPIELTKHKDKDCMNENDKKAQMEIEEVTDIKETDDHNITDDIRIAKIPSNNLMKDNKDVEIEQETKISVPPRRKKLNATVNKPVAAKTVVSPIIYPGHLNPFSDDEEEESIETSKKVSTNPFGSSDEDDDGPPVQPPKVPSHITSTPVKRLIAVNPFWSDGEEPSTDDEDVNYSKSSLSEYSSMATSTPNLRSLTPRRMKPKAPPPPVITITESSHSHATSMDDVASISSLGSCNSTINSEQRTPQSRRKGPAPTPPPPDSLSTVSEGGSMDKTADSDLRNASGSDCGKKAKGPAPGLPLPERREVKLQMSPEELQVQLDLLETQQLGLERQGVLIERMIRDKCEGDEACTAPQEEVEDLVIQLCELVNEKNDLFRKQTELMYIRRQQRLEQEQADIEHEIRIIQSRPAVNRIDADKAREEQLVSRLVEIVRLRDELVQQLDAERRRERQEDLAIAASIASKRAQRTSDASLKSVDAVTTQKKNKVKDKMKKQFKKAKHTLYSKKKDSGDSSERKEGKEGKMDKSK